MPSNLAQSYKITIESDTFDIGKRSTAHSLRNALKSPAFIITSTMFSTIICMLTIVSRIGLSTVLGTLSESEIDMLDKQYSQILQIDVLLL